jgi:hypothetical protein
VAVSALASPGRPLRASEADDLVPPLPGQSNSARIGLSPRPKGAFEPLASYDAAAAACRSAAYSTKASSASGSARSSRLATFSAGSPHRIRFTGSSSFWVRVFRDRGNRRDHIGHAARRQRASQRSRDREASVKQGDHVAELVLRC